MKKECTVIVLAAACTLAFAGGPKSVFTPWIDKWPSSPITVVCPWAVGGVVDIVNRKLASYGEEVFGQPVVAPMILFGRMPSPCPTASYSP